MNNVTKRQTCLERTYEFIKTYGPVDSKTIRYEVGKYYKNGIMMGEMKSDLTELHGKGMIESVGLTKEHRSNIWVVKE